MCSVVSAGKEKNIFFSKVDVKIRYGQEMGWNLPSSVTLLFEDQ